jgi:hypothetical protein
MSSLDGNASCTASSSKAKAASRYLMVMMGFFVVAAILAHGFALNAMRSVDGGEIAESGAISHRTWLFAGVGFAFLAFTWLSHLPLVQMLRSNSATQHGEAVVPGNTAADLGPFAGLLVSMAIRIAGTFAILGLLWKAEFVSREETVFDVLFWYVTLTAMEVVGIVWASRSLVRSSPLGSVARVGDSKYITIKS